MKVDPRKELDSYQARHGQFRFLDVPPQQYLMVDGEGDPNTAPAYADALAALYPVAYKLKFASKRELDRDYVVMPLEALWWAADMTSFTSDRDKSRWSWTAMIMVPEWTTAGMFEVALAEAGSKQPLPSLEHVRLETLREGRCVQTLHLGSYDDEGPVIARLHAEIAAADPALTPVGKHHEIYLNDARKVAPEKLRTIIRQPVGPP